MTVSYVKRTYSPARNALPLCLHRSRQHFNHKHSNYAGKKCKCNHVLVTGRNVAFPPREMGKSWSQDQCHTVLSYRRRCQMWREIQCFKSDLVSVNRDGQIHLMILNVIRWGFGILFLLWGACSCLPPTSVFRHEGVPDFCLKHRLVPKIGSCDMLGEQLYNSSPVKQGKKFEKKSAQLRMPWDPERWVFSTIKTYSYYVKPTKSK